MKEIAVPVELVHAVFTMIERFTYVYLAASLATGGLAWVRGRRFLLWTGLSIIATPFMVVALFALPKLRDRNDDDSSLVARTAKAASYRLGVDRAVELASAAKGKVEDFANRAELDREIKNTVRERFRNRP